MSVRFACAGQRAFVVAVIVDVYRARKRVGV